MTEQEEKFAKNFLLGMTRTQAAKAAGYAKPEIDGERLIRSKEVQAYLAAEAAAYVDASGVSRKQVVEGMLEAIDMAKTMADPQTMIVGYRELARMLGYNAPEKKQIEVNVRGRVEVQQLEQLSDDELLKLMAPAAIEGEAVRLEEAA